MARSRRAFLRSSALGVGSALAAALSRAQERGSLAGAARTGPYGELAAAGPELALPPDFRYLKFGVEGTPLGDGRPTPKGHDGMAAFPAGPARVRLVRNHEVSGVATVPIGTLGRSYDVLAGGGTTTLVVRLVPGGPPVLERSLVSLSGTAVNCAGGPTPWGSWLSCEETTGHRALGWGRPHGYVFEVPAEADAEVDPVPLRDLGRFVHEAAAVDPETSVVYLTEDANEAGLYRFLPRRPRRLAEGGRLEMLAVTGQPRFPAFEGHRNGLDVPAHWVPIAEPDPAEADVNPAAVFVQGAALGGAVFRRLEGCAFAGGRLVFQSTSGGALRLGQVWQYTPEDASRGRLTLLYESASPLALDAPDNIMVTPRGALLICEDGGAGNSLRVLTRDGSLFELARNVANAREFAGATFSPDGRVLFVNIQGSGRAAEDSLFLGMTFAIWGPWDRGPI